ncbi:MAG: site-specific DNA-methyltransferase [Candidatus Spyradocola sp.]|nr:site-specific DNA-methyltransferase [Candidatus Spyradocola sp.]
MAENLFYFGDAYQALERLAAENRRVQLCAIDPPYRTGKNFGAYDDRASSEDYYAMMRQVLQGIYDVLDDAGSLFVHIDERAHARLRLMLDDIFGERNFRNEIVWAYRSGGRATTHFSRKHDILLYYVKSDAAYFDAMQDAVPRASARRNHMKRELDEQGRPCRTIRSGGRVYRYYDDDLVPPSDVWDDIPHLQQRDPERTGYPTQKPRRLLERIIKCASRPGDTVLDVFAGSGTTLDAAHALGRAFIGADSAPQSLEAVKIRLAHTGLRIVEL